MTYPQRLVRTHPHLRAVVFGGARVGLTLTAGAMVQIAPAQVSVPIVQTMAATPQRLSAAEVDFRIRVREARLDAGISIRQVGYPRDSIRKVVEGSAAQWLTYLQQQPIEGIQLDPAGAVSVAAGNEAIAKSQIATRLATPGLSRDDRAYTYMAAVQSFTSWQHPERLPTAEAYLVALDALGEDAALQQFQARNALMGAYYMLGRSADLARLGTQAIGLVGRMSFVERENFFHNTSVYTMAVEALTSFGDGLRRITALNDTLRASIVPSRALMALDSAAFGYRANEYARLLEGVISTNALLGTRASPLIANYWVNRPSRDSAAISLDDGKIHIVEFAAYGCPGCLVGVVGLQRVWEQFPGVDVMFMTFTYGSWGNRLVEPREEAKNLEEHIHKKMKLKIPVGIYMCPKTLNEEGGMMRANDGPNDENFRVGGGSLTIAVDGRGIIRRIFAVGGRDLDVEAARTVRFLMAEAASR